MSVARYHVKIVPQSHLLEVQLLLEGVAAGPVHLQVPTWVPGAYGFLKYGRDFYDLTAHSNGVALAVHREGWQGFRVEGARDSLEVRFKVYSHDPAWGELTGLVDHEHAVLIGPRYLHAKAHRGPVRVRYELPEGWALHHPDGARELAPGHFEYPSFEVLYDTPVVAGRFTTITRACAGTPFHFIFLDQAPGFPRHAEALIDGILKVAQACHELFGGFPFAHYSFVFTFNPAAGWGLEHLTSTMIALGEHALIDPEELQRGIRVCAHELFHAWNVCRLKPAPLARPDFTQGSFTDGLWVAEGVTRYYEFLLLVRAGVLTAEQFFSNILNYHRHLVAQPGYARTSVLDSSVATFLNHNRYPGSINNTIDYYDHGMLVAFDLDAHLRCLDAPSSLDREFRAFYEAFAGRNEGFTHEDWVGFFGGRTQGTEALLRREVEQAGTLQVPRSLERLGFTLRSRKVRRAGLVLKKNQGPILENLVEGLPAFESGLAPGDELVRVNGFPFHLKALTWSIAQGEPLRLEVRRGHRYLGFELTSVEQEELAELRWTGTPAQLARLRGWLGVPALIFGDAPLSLSHFENFHGIQTVL